MIKLLTQTGYTVLRLDPSGDPDVQDGIRIVGLYETKAEAEFIARKALKMEKSTVLAAALKRNPNMKPVKLSSSIINAAYNVVHTPVHEGNHDEYSPRYSNGESCVKIHLEELKENKSSHQNIRETLTDGLTFKDWILEREGGNYGRR